MKRLVLFLVLVSLFLHVTECAKKKKKKKKGKRVSYPKERIMENLWEDGGYVFGAASPGVTDPDFRAFYDDHVHYFKNQTLTLSNAFWGVDDNFLDELAALKKYQILYYLDYFSSGIDSHTIFVAVPAGVPSDPPFLSMCDLEECIYAISLDPYLDLSDIPPDEVVMPPLIDEIQDVFLESWRSSKSVMAFKDYKGTVCEKENLAVLRGQLETIDEELRVEGEGLGSADFLKSPKGFSLSEAEEQLRFLHKQLPLQVMSLLVSSMCK